MRKCFVLVLLLAFPSSVFGATKYVSPTGSGTTCSAVSPCSASYAFANAVAGDTWLWATGTYNLGSSSPSNMLQTAHSGTGDADANRIIMKADTGATPTIVSDISGNSSDNGGIIKIDHNYWTIDGFTINGTLGTPEIHACVRVGYTSSPVGAKVKNCTLYVVTGAISNVAAILTSNASNCTFQNNILHGNSVQAMGWQNLDYGTGNKFLNNIVYGFRTGISDKHANQDTSIGTAEWAYNHIYGNSSECIRGIGNHVNVHDNILNSSGSSFAINWGDADGAGSGQGVGMLFEHNTIIGLFFVQDQGVGALELYQGYVINNVITGGYQFDYVSTQNRGTWDYNLYGNMTAIGAHDIGNHMPTFVGGSTPSTIAGYALTAASYGYHAADDGRDMGADVTLVGLTSADSDTTAPTVSITTSSPQTITSDSLTVTGTASDAMWGTGSACKWRVNGEPGASAGTACTGTTSWSCAASGFSQGSNTLYVECGDAVPNWSTGHSITVNYQPGPQTGMGFSMVGADMR